MTGGIGTVPPIPDRQHRLFLESLRSELQRLRGMASQAAPSTDVTALQVQLAAITRRIAAVEELLQDIDLDPSDDPPAIPLFKSYNFAYGDATPLPLGPLSGMVFVASIVITQPFDGVGAALTLRTVDMVTLMAANQNNPAEVARYEVSPGYDLGAGREVELVVTPGSGASQGAGIVYLEMGT